MCVIFVYNFQENLPERCTVTGVLGDHILLYDRKVVKVMNGN